MQLQSHLVHAAAERRVVLVGAWQQGVCLGSALGEGSSAEEAEDRAIERLRRRLLPTTAAPVRLDQAEPSLHPPTSPPPPVTAEAACPEPPIEAKLPALPEPPADQEPPADPEDWSDELAEVELQLKRLQWGRQQEATYLGRVFGHPSRGRLVRYADLLSYRNALRQLEPGSDPALVPPPLRRPELLALCDQLLGQLHWGPARGRQFLERHFSLASRQQLSDEQLLQFNMLLEGVLIGEQPDG